MKKATRASLLIAALIILTGVPSAARQHDDLWKDPQFQQRFLGTYGVLGEMEPRVSPAERAELEKIIPLMSTDLGKAAEQLRAGTTESSSALFDFTLGNIEFQSDRLEEAARHYQAAVKKYPNFLRAHKNLGLVYIRTGEMADAITSLTRMIELGGGDGLSYGFLGHAYASRQNYLSAESSYRQASLLQPESIDWKTGLALCLFKQGKYGEAAALTGALIDAHPERVDFWQLQANAWLGLKEPMKAAQNYEMLSLMGKSTVEIQNALGDIYLNESSGDLATRAYLAAIELDPSQDVSRPLRAAELLAARGTLSGARQLLERIKETRANGGAGILSETDRKRLLKLESRIAITEGNGEDAARVLEEIVALDPLDGDALMLLAQHYSRSEDNNRAAFYYERAEGIAAFEADARVRHAQMLVSESRYLEAVPLLKRAQELKPREEVARYLEQVERIARAAR